MTTLIITAILWLAPQVTPAEAWLYGEAIHREAERWDVDPLLVVAVIQRESSWNPKARSKTHDFGLGQIHVSKTTNPHLLGREHILFEPRRNIRYLVRMLSWWRVWHVRFCGKTNRASGHRGASSNHRGGLPRRSFRRIQHPFWAHFKYGRRIPRNRKGKKVDAIYQDLVAKFRSPGV